MSERVDTIRIIKAQLWEEAKGKLRALVAVNGSARGSDDYTPEWPVVEGAVEAFIKSFEGDGLHE